MSDLDLLWSISCRFGFSRTLRYLLYVPSAVGFTDVAGGPMRSVLEEGEVLAVDRLADEPFLEHHGVYGKQVVAHHPRVLQVCRGRNEIGDEDGRLSTRLDEDNLGLAGGPPGP